MGIKLAEHSGFCFGVREAIRKTEETIDSNRQNGVRIYTCGPLIHNKTVTEDLEKRGVYIISDPGMADEGATIIVRSHGEPESFYPEAERKKLNVVDATCPFVSKIHKIVKEAARIGRNVVIIGDANHPEVIGIKGWAGVNCQVIGSIDDAKKIDYDTITLVAQTTITAEFWDEIADYLSNNKEDVIALRTICNATTERQKSCKNTAMESDVMIVIGDWNSSNSRKLFEIAKENCKKTYFVENKKDLPLKEIEKCDRIGVAAGASTPERIIKEVISTMSEVITENNEMQEAEAVETKEAVNAAEEVYEAKDIAEEETNLMDDFMDQIDKSLILPSRGEIVEGEIVHVSNREVVVNLGCKKDGIIPKEEMIIEGDHELTELYKEGDMIQAKVIKTDDGDGNILLSKKKLEVNEHWDEINEALDNKSVVNAKVVKEVKGGVIAVYKEVSGFIPMSQLSDKFVEKANEFVGKVLPVKVSRVDQKEQGCLRIRLT